ncbi:outer membrane beta-barrel protein [Flavobacterium sp.]|jgi:outer membrane protein|uniref:outer membrane beta-barrel protein n=1 Tax=Flavobacterium sp. TaxID=239 RepID=UPI0037C0D42E
MKKIILTVAAVFAFGFANAQDDAKNVKGFSKGDMFLEGSFGVRSGNTSQGPNDVETSYTFSPKVGYMINEKIALGVRIDATQEKFYSENKTNTFGAGVFARYFFLSLGEDKSFQAYGQASLGFSGTKEKDSNGNEIGKSDNLNGGIDLGMNYFLTKNWAITFTLANLVSYDTVDNGGESNNGLNVQVGTINNPFAVARFGLLYKW